MVKRISTLAIVLLLNFLPTPHTYAAPSSTDAEATKETKTPSSDAAVPFRDIYHEVAPYETIWRISAMYGVPVEDILKANSLPPKPILKAGQKILIPHTKGPRPNIPLFPTDRWKSIVIHQSNADEGNAYSINQKNQERGLGDEGDPHFIIDNGTRGKAVGQIELGMPWLKQLEAGPCPISEKQSQKGTISIVLIGNFNEKGLPDKQLNSLVFLTKTLEEFYRIKSENVLWHDEMCPGKYFPEKEFLRRLEEYKPNSTL